MASRKRCPVVLAATVLATFAAAPAGAADQPATTRISVSTNGIQSTGGDNQAPLISANGGFVAFSSPATNLVPDDTNAKKDVFVRELGSGVTTRVSVNSVGDQANGDSVDPAISADGRFVVFNSAATNLVGGDSNSLDDVFIHDLRTGQTTRVSVSSAGVQALVGHSSKASVSGDGRLVAFLSNADNLVGGDTNGKTDVFVHDRLTGATTRVNLGPGNVQADGNSAFPVISADGRVVVFSSDATNLVTGDSNGKKDVFVRDLAAGKTRRVSLGAGGAQANGDSINPSPNADGSAVAYQSVATNLVPGDTNALEDVFVTRGSHTARVSLGAGNVQGNGGSSRARLSDDGLSVVFISSAANLVPHDTNGTDDVFMVRSGKPERISLGPGAAEADHASSGASISTDGKIAYASDATNLVDDDTNAATDIFVALLRSTHGGFALFP